MIHPRQLQKNRWLQQQQNQWFIIREGITWIFWSMVLDYSSLKYFQERIKTQSPGGFIQTKLAKGFDHIFCYRNIPRLLKLFLGISWYSTFGLDPFVKWYISTIPLLRRISYHLACNGVWHLYCFSVFILF